MPQPLRSFGADDRLPCIKCGKGWMDVIRRNHIDNSTERQILICHECGNEITRTVGKDGIGID
ncbi:MAG TPA: hypothetical protein VM867_01900 [Xanthobacteraceae bacterium]|nr:hypothetical protein [Xanthobacteraceae bacterium]